MHLFILSTHTQHIRVATYVYWFGLVLSWFYNKLNGTNYTACLQWSLHRKWTNFRINAFKPAGAQIHPIEFLSNYFFLYLIVCLSGCCCCCCCRIFVVRCCLSCCINWQFSLNFDLYIWTSVFSRNANRMTWDILNFCGRSNNNDDDNNSGDRSNAEIKLTTTLHLIIHWN